ncbi:DUF721 domain-containing protein [Arthrobacter deserti]|uniref:DUF721 domain-containing protein n=1 Tax=Arthrobacter deserti TaxID=1742687 RepID=A0ABX1JS17_9MICC|nr:DUF721 domain-containing protein [Arthrobacter deserti]
MADKQPEEPAGQGPDPVPAQDMDAARAMLNRMREAAAARGEVRARPGTRRTPAGGPAPGRSRGAGRPGTESGRDPQGLGTVFNRLVRDRGWNSPVAVGSVISRWDELVGPDIAAHCRPESFQDTTVQVRCDSTAWATQLRLLSSALLARFDEALGSGVVTKIQVLAPAAPNWRKGPRSSGGRGPRDPYG